MSGKGRKKGRRSAKRKIDADRKAVGKAFKDARPTVPEAHQARAKVNSAWLGARTNDPVAQLMSRQMETVDMNEQSMTLSGALNAEEFEELKALVPDAVPKYQDELRSKIGDLANLISKFNPLVVLSHVTFTYGMVLWGDYFEPGSNASEAVTEFAAGLAISATIPDDATGPDPTSLNKILSDLDEVFRLARHINLCESLAADRTAENAIRFTARAQHLSVRGSSYPHHGRQLADHLYASRSTLMKERLGYSFEDMVAMEQTISSTMAGAVSHLLEAIEQKVERDFPPDRSKWPEEFSALVERVGVDAALMGVRRSLLAEYLVEMMTFTVDEVVNASGVSKEAVEAILAAYSTPLGESSTTYDSPFSTSPLVQRPFVRWGDRYMLPVVGLVGREFVSLMEPAMLALTKAGSDDRAKALDTYTVRLLAPIFPGCASYTNLTYEYQGGTPEVDGLIVWGDIAIVVEGKGNPLGEPSIRGDVARLRNELKRTIEAAWKQAKRVREFLLSDEEAVFHTEQGEQVVIEPGQIQKVYIVNPTLHPMQDYASQLPRLRSLGLFKDGEYPFSVFVNDLKVITDVVNNAAEFLHYLDWRERLPLGEAVVVVDELDLFGAYLLRAQFSRKLALGEIDFIEVLGSTVDFDDYFMGEAGQGPKGRKPGMFYETPPLRRFVETLAKERPEGWLDAAGTCLDLSLVEVALVGNALKMCQRQEIPETGAFLMPSPTLEEMGGVVEPEDAPSLAIVVLGRRQAWDDRDIGSVIAQADAEHVVFISRSNASNGVVRWAITRGDANNR